MPTDSLPCRLCADPARYLVEQAYLTGARTGLRGYTRPELESHLAHVVDPQALRLVSDLAGASAVAARLRALEQLATSIIDVALSQDPPDARLALQALREARSTLVEVGRLSEALQAAAPTADESRPDLDAALSSWLAAEGHAAADVEGEPPSPTHEPRALMPAAE